MRRVWAAGCGRMVSNGDQTIGPPQESCGECNPLLTHWLNDIQKDAKMFAERWQWDFLIEMLVFKRESKKQRGLTYTTVHYKQCGTYCNLTDRSLLFVSYCVIMFRWLSYCVFSIRVKVSRLRVITAGHVLFGLQSGCIGILCFYIKLGCWLSFVIFFMFLLSLLICHI